MPHRNEPIEQGERVFKLHRERDGSYSPYEQVTTAELGRIRIYLGSFWTKADALDYVRFTYGGAQVR
jgi:hypothetical protein